MSGRPAVSSDLRRGACPALSAPMQTGDGLLSRIAFTDDLRPDDLVKLCDLASHYGNGLIDITARGGLQFRGLTADSALLLERDVLSLDLPLRRGLAVEVSPLSGVDGQEIADPRPVARQIAAHALALDLAQRLAPKMSVVVDGGGSVSMGQLLADIRLRAVPYDGGVVWALMLGGSEDSSLRAGLLAQDDAASCVIDTLDWLAARGPDARGRDLDPESVSELLGASLLPLSSLRDASSNPSFTNETDQERRPLPDLAVRRHRRLLSLAPNLSAAVISPAFGQVEADLLAALCATASALGITSVRPGPGHALYFVGSEQACAALLEDAERTGFVVGDGDLREAIAVCPGSPACGSAFAPVKALAAFAADECASMLDGSFMLHLSGCGKGCAHPSPALMTFSGMPDGLGFGFNARASALPDLVLQAADETHVLSRLARLYEKEHKPGENARALYTRLGRDRIVAALRQDET